MKSEKIIKPANGYLMLFILIALFFGCIATAIRTEDPRFLIGHFYWFLWTVWLYLSKPKYFEGGFAFRKVHRND